MTRGEILDTAKGYVNVDRAAVHGDAQTNFEIIAALWSAYAQHPFSTADIAVMMALMKCARIKANPGHVDSWVDLAGYAACGGEIATGAGE